MTIEAVNKLKKEYAEGVITEDELNEFFNDIIFFLVQDEQSELAAKVADIRDEILGA